MTLFVALGALLALLTLLLLTRPLWRRARVDVAPAEAPRSSKPLLFGVTSFICAIAVAGYAWIGTPRALNGELVAAAPAGADGPITSEQIEAMINGLTARLKDKPDDVEGWAMLGRSLMVLGRHDQAVPALQKAVALRGEPGLGWSPRIQALKKALGNQYFDKGAQAWPTNVAQAIKDWETSLRYDPQNAKAAARLKEARAADAKQPPAKK